MAIPVRIDTLDDPRVADYRHVTSPAHLLERSLFVVEGRLVVERLLALPQWTTHSVLVTKAAADSIGATLDRAAAPVYLADQALMNDIAGFNIHRGCLALAARQPTRARDRGVATHGRRVLILEGVSNPDNIGGLFRSAEAFGVDLVVLGPECADPFSPKAVRASMGSIFARPPARAGFGELGGTRVALDSRASHPCGDVPRPAVLCLGGEREGLPDDVLANADVTARIPLREGGPESLNVAAAAAIGLYELQACCARPTNAGAAPLRRMADRG